MSIEIDLDPEAEALLRKLAESEKTDSLSLAKRLLQSALQDRQTPTASIGPSAQEKIAAMRRDVEEFGKRHPLPSLPDEAMTREAIYQDHD